MRVAVLSDTHGPRYWKGCPPAVAAQLSDVELILHAGDVCVPQVLQELSEFAPVRVVLGNNDGAAVADWGATSTLELSIEGFDVAMIHDSGAAQGRGPRLRRLFPRAALVVFGHSHVPWNEVHDGQRSFNPGSPTNRRAQPRGTMGLLDIADGRLRSAVIVAVTP